MFEQPKRPEKREESFEFLDAAALGKVLELAKGASPELAPYLTAPNAILSLAGVKPMADIHVQSSKEALSVDEDFLKTVLECSARIRTSFPDIYLTTDGEVLKHLAGPEKSILLTARNLRGIERVSRASRLSGVPCFDHSTGPEGFKLWYKELETGISNAQDRGELPSGDVSREIIIQGIECGYPDQAILDFVDWYQTGQKKEIEQAALVREPGGRISADPSYFYYPEHASNSSIIENIKTSNAILSSFYSSQEYKALQEI